MDLSKLTLCILLAFWSMPYSLSCWVGLTYVAGMTVCIAAQEDQVAFTGGIDRSNGICSKTMYLPQPSF